jgi:class 3 adenylate cyclase/tetratricopeptide (TPR) repeat protein
MRCPQCQFENREGAKFCKKCGNKFELLCPSCGHPYQADSIFCDECGCNFNPAPGTSNDISETAGQPFSPSIDKPDNDVSPVAGERKHVTVLFSDLTGYTAMSEKLDPEEVKEITSRIFGEISKVVAKYDGFVEKYAGDAVMALFGATASHEDDPVRAINAAREIHNLVDSISPQYEERIGQPLTMHTGINTGLVVTGEVNFEKGTHGVAGDTVNVAARLSGLGSAGEILVSRDTYTQSEGYFDFEGLGHSKIKGKSEPVKVYKVLALKSQPVKIHRLHGLRAKLIGRKVEMDLLAEAVKKLQDGKGSILSICGTAGTGKSRLVEEFKSSLNLAKVQWLEGHAYPFTQNMPYYPLINLLNRSLRIEEADPPEIVREKIESGLSDLIGNESEFIKIIGSLYALSFPEIDAIDPEYWKPQLQKAVQRILSSLSRQAPTIVCLEDLHWADPSFIELIRLLLAEARDSILFVCIYRPVISLFSSHQIKSMTNPYQEIRLQDLSPSESQGMMESLLKTEIIPAELKRFVQDKVEGNPFYVEEMINSLIESETLVRDDDIWKVARPITESEISSTIHGVIAGRLDRLEKEAKQIIQEASVIGRAFLYKILKKISQLPDHIDKSLGGFERLDLIRTQSAQPDLEYVFKHALTQEVVYNGLLKKERRKIHERIGLVMEQLFADRLAEIYETLAFHFTQAQSLHKAVDYLVKSGEKSLRRYALEESHQYFKESFNLLTGKPDLTEADKELLIDILIKWAYVYYYRGDFKGLVELFRPNEQTAKSLNDKTKRGFFLAWLGMALWIRENLKESERYLREALELGQAAEDQRLTGYACCWLSMTCSDLGLFDEALELAERGHEVARLLESDHYLYFKSLHAKGFAYFYMGYCKENLQIGKTLLDYGNKHSNFRCSVLGHMSVSFAHWVAGNPALALEASKEAVKASADPVYSIIPNSITALSYFQMGEFKEAEKIARATLAFSEKFGCEYHGTAASIVLDLVMIANGKMAMGLKRIEDLLQQFRETEKKSFIPTGEHILGKIYFQIATGEGPLRLSTLLKNAVFLAKTLPVANKRAEYHFNKAVDLAQEIGARGIEGQAYLDLGLLYKTQKRKDQAQQYISKAIEVFEETNAEVFLKQARQAMESLE